MTTAHLADYLTTEQVARELGVTTGRVRQLARAYRLGTMVGRGRLYSRGDVEAMRTRRTRHPATIQGDTDHGDATNA